jgi:hypothetical protein
MLPRRISGRRFKAIAEVAVASRSHHGGSRNRPAPIPVKPRPAKPRVKCGSAHAANYLPLAYIGAQTGIGVERPPEPGGMPPIPTCLEPTPQSAPIRPGDCRSPLCATHKKRTKCRRNVRLTRIFAAGNWPVINSLWSKLKNRPGFSPSEEFLRCRAQSQLQKSPWR